jgi:hypothetical protein
VAKAAAVSDGAPDADSIARNLRRWWEKKYGPPKGARPPRGSPVEPFIYPGLGVLYDVLHHRIEALTRQLWLPGSEQQKRDLVSIGLSIKRALKRRKAQLEKLCRSEVARPGAAATAGGGSAFSLAAARSPLLSAAALSRLAIAGVRGAVLDRDPPKQSRYSG